MRKRKSLLEPEFLDFPKRTQGYQSPEKKRKYDRDLDDFVQYIIGMDYTGY